jgi:hypothetical protein
MYLPLGISERDYTQTNINKYKCGNFKLFKSDIVKNHYSNLLLSNENNKNYYKNLIKQTTNNTNIIGNYIKLLIQYAELINKYYNEVENYSNKNKDIIYDTMILHWLEYYNYHEALILLSSNKDNKNKLFIYDNEDQIDILNYKTNLSAIQFVYAKIKYYSDNQHDLNIIQSIIEQYKISHDDNILNQIKEIETSNKIIEGFENTNTYNYVIIFIIVILIYKIIC